MISKELLKGTLQTIVLRLLEDNGRMYGYEITQKVKNMTGGEITLTEGALYPTLHKLEASGLVQTEKEYVGKRVRKYYKLTPSGNEVIAVKISEFETFVDVMKHVLFPKKTLK